MNLSGVNGNVIMSGWKDDNPDHETGKTVLRDYINATVGFDKLATVTKKSSKSLMRMLGPKGNPQARNFFEIVAYLQKKEGLRLRVRAM